MWLDLSVMAACKNQRILKLKIYYFSSITGDTNLPKPSISIVQVSPCFRYLGGLLYIPTPPGVPVKITSPSFSVQTRLIQLMINFKFILSLKPIKVKIYRNIKNKVLCVTTLHQIVIYPRLYCQTCWINFGVNDWSKRGKRIECFTK